MNRQGASFYLRSMGPNDSNLIAGVEWLLHEAKSFGNPCIVAAYDKQNLVNLESWATNASLFRQLRENGCATTQGVAIDLLTKNSQSPSSFNGPILVLFNEDMLDTVDSIGETAPVLFIAFRPNVGQRWIDKWRATELG